MKGKMLSALLVVLLCLGMFAAFPLSNASPTAILSILNPDDTHDLAHVTTIYDGKIIWNASHTYGTKADGTAAGLNDTVFHTDTKLDSVFYVRVRLDDVVDLFSWQINVTFNPALLQCVDVIFPDPTFKFTTFYGKAIDNDKGFVMTGYSHLAGEPLTRGSGDLAWIIFKVVSIPGYAETLSSLLEFSKPYGKTTFLKTVTELGPVTITDVNVYDGYYEIYWTPPEKHPYYVVVPNVYKAKNLGEDVYINITVKDVDSAWYIVGFQFVLRFNATLLEPIELIPGGFMEQFVDDGEDILYTGAHDYLNNPELPTGYNAWAVFVQILPNATPAGGVWIPPFPDGEGTLVTLKFRAIYETISPTEAWTDLTFTRLSADAGKYIKGYAINQYGEKISLATCVGGNYRAPIKVLGLAIDLYSQYPDGFNGKGANEPSDSFAPQALVILHARVTYNEDPVQNKTVAFEVRHGEFYIYRAAQTDESGIATVSFNIPWPCNNPAERVLGEWNAIATVEVAERVVNDTMPFIVWWQVEVVSVEPKVTTFLKGKRGTSHSLDFTMEYRTYHMQPVTVTLTITIYDELGFVIGYAILTTEISSPAYGVPGTATWEPSVPMPSNAVVGKCTVYGNAFSNLPWNGGTAYCPEKTNTIDFYIARSM